MSNFKDIEELYENGKNLYEQKDYENALKFLKKATEKGNLEAMILIGEMYYNGDGVKIDKLEALRYYTKVVGIEYNEAINISYPMEIIGFMYQYGEGVRQNTRRAIEWYLKSAELGNISAIRAIGDIYRYGEGAEPNLYMALNWYKKAAALGDNTALRRIDDVLENLNLRIDTEEKSKWNQKDCMN